MQGARDIASAFGVWGTGLLANDVKLVHESLVSCLHLLDRPAQGCGVYGLWFVVCGLWFEVCGLECVVCGLWFVMWFVVCGSWFMVYGLWFVVCGLGC